ncbi:MAG: serine protease AprX [Bacteroidia bacterium]|jgi:serine protease AprX
MRGILVFSFLIFSAACFGQSGPKQYWIQFSDKSNTPFSLSNPSEYLSQRALDRRNVQRIDLNETDLPVDPAYIQAVLNEGAEYLTHSKWLNSVSVRIPDTAMLISIVALPFVVNHTAVGKKGKQAQRSEKLEVAMSTKIAAAADDAEDEYGAAFNQIDMLGGLNLHQAGYMGQGMLIAVLDAGFPNVNTLSVFDSLHANNRLISTWDFVAQNDSVYNDHPHGQLVLSTMASYSPGIMIGTAPEASYMLLRTEDATTEFPIEEDYWVAGAEYADSAGADIINSSLGYTTFLNSIYDHTYDDLDGNTTHAAIGADFAASKGILVVNSAGNSGNSAWQYIGTPADGDSVLAIGAVDAEGNYAAFSSIGPSSDGDIKPNVCAQGQQAAIINEAGNPVLGNGTSFSSPIMAGMAACLWQAYPDMTNMELLHAIEASSHKYNNPDQFYGYGIPNFAMANLILSGYSPTNLDESELLPVFPNPFSNQIDGAFYSSSKQEVKVRLVNGLGQTLNTMEGSVGETCAVTFQFTGLDNLTEGVYYVQVDADSGKYLRKMVKLRD